MENRTGKQCRERWHNQLNPLLKKANWSVEEDWILYILHQTVRNRWAEITNVLLGRSDNSIKNYWNSTLCHKQAALEQDLNDYLKQQVVEIDPVQVPKKKQQIMQGLLQYYINVAQNQYFDYIRNRIEQLRLEPVQEATEKINAFKIKLLEHAITPEDELQRLQETTIISNPKSSSLTIQNLTSTLQAASSDPSQDAVNKMTHTAPKLKVMLELRELK